MIVPRGAVTCRRGKLSTRGVCRRLHASAGKVAGDSRSCSWIELSIADAGKRRTLTAFFGRKLVEAGSILELGMMCAGSRGYRVAVRLRGDLWFGETAISSGFRLHSCRRKALRIDKARHVDACRGELVLAHRGSPHGEARGVTGGVRGRSCTSPRAENAVERGTARWRCPRCSKRPKLEGRVQRPCHLGSERRKADRRRDAKRVRLDSCRGRPGESREARESRDPLSARVGASVADGGSKRIASSPR